MRRLPHPVSRCEDTRVILAARDDGEKIAPRALCVHGNNFAPPFAYIIKKLLLSDKNTHSLALTHSLHPGGGGGCAINNFRTHLYTCPFFQKSSSVCAREGFKKKTRESHKRSVIYDLWAVSVSLSDHHTEPPLGGSAVSVCVCGATVQKLTNCRPASL